MTPAGILFNEHSTDEFTITNNRYGLNRQTVLGQVAGTRMFQTPRSPMWNIDIKIMGNQAPDRDVRSTGSSRTPIMESSRHHAGVAHQLRMMVFSEIRVRQSFVKRGLNVSMRVIVVICVYLVSNDSEYDTGTPSGVLNPARTAIPTTRPPPRQYYWNNSQRRQQTVQFSYTACLAVVLKFETRE
ncbi:hypothetical protein BDR03DRAFT_1065726 [Suillus americanus]|nr:hypothetical protein BDR03DRAFT_1065726 [Suillus americanus]